MKIYTQRRNIKEWLSGDSNPDWWVRNASIAKELRALNPDTCTSRDICLIMIKHRMWGAHIDLDNHFLPRCNECGKDVHLVIEVGEEPDYESHTAQICPSCFDKAFKLLREETEKKD